MNAPSGSPILNKGHWQLFKEIQYVPFFMSTEKLLLYNKNTYSTKVNMYEYPINSQLIC